MKITREIVEHVGKLARLDLSEQEVDTFTGQMDAMLAYVEKLNELDTDNVSPTAHAVPMQSPWKTPSVMMSRHPRLRWTSHLPPHPTVSATSSASRK